MKDSKKEFDKSDLEQIRVIVNNIKNDLAVFQTYVDRLEECKEKNIGLKNNIIDLTNNFIDISLKLSMEMLDEMDEEK